MGYEIVYFIRDKYFSTVYLGDIPPGNICKYKFKSYKMVIRHTDFD